MTSNRNLSEFDNLFSRSLKSMGGKIQEGPWPIHSDRLDVLYGARRGAATERPGTVQPRVGARDRER